MVPIQTTSKASAESCETAFQTQIWEQTDMLASHLYEIMYRCNNKNWAMLAAFLEDISIEYNITDEAPNGVPPPQMQY